MTNLRRTAYECQRQRQFGWWTGSSMQWTNAAIAWPLTLVKPAETLALDWLNTNERQKRAISLITLLNTISRKKNDKNKKYKKKNDKKQQKIFKKMIKNNRKQHHQKKKKNCKKPKQTDKQTKPITRHKTISWIMKWCNSFCLRWWPLHRLYKGSVTTKNSPFQNFTHHGRTYSKVQNNN